MYNRTYVLVKFIYGCARTDFADIPIGMPAEDYNGQEYGVIVYGRGPIFLYELAQEMGQDTFDAFLRDYVETFIWQITSSEDFQDPGRAALPT